MRNKIWNDAFSTDSTYFMQLMIFVIKNPTLVHDKKKKKKKYFEILL